MNKKIAILADLHLNIKNSPIFHNYFRKFFEIIFFPYLIKNNISIVIQMGDIMDKKSGTDYFSLGESFEYFFDPLSKIVDQFIVFPGNHDLSQRNTLKYNAPDLLLKNYKNFTVINEPTTLNIYGRSIDHIPWLCEFNQKESLEFISNSTSDYCIGHFEMKDIPMNKYQISEHGMEQDLFVNYHKVISGHYHSFSETKNIIYPGTPYHLNFSDVDEIKQFMILDLETDKIEYIKNPYKLFHKIYYDDTKSDYTNLDFTQYTDTFTKIIIENKTKPLVLENLIINLQNAQVYEYKISENVNEYEITEEALEEIQTDDTISLIHKTIDSIENIDNQSVKKIINQIYEEALVVQNY